MRLSRLLISNHSRLEDLDIEVREHLVIVGANDVGKTSLLRCLNFVLGATVQQLYQGLTVQDLADPAFPMVCRATLLDFTEEERALFPDEISIAPDGGESLVVELLVEVSVEDPEQVAVRRSYPDGGSRSPSREQLAAIGWQFLPATRSSSVDFMEGKRSPLKTMLAATNLGADREELAATLDSFNAKLESNPALSELRSKLADHLSRSMPKTMTSDQLTIRTTTDPQTDVLDEVTLFLKSEDTAAKALAEQSDGVRQLMTMTFFDLAQSAANIVAIDEPELHLHASSQRTVADLFAQGSSQRLLVTHSPYIVQRFEPRHVLTVTAERTVRQIPESSFTAVDKERANWWSPHLLEALTARHALLVEGAADRVIVEACARASGISLDRLGVTVLELGGADKFKHVNKLLGDSGFNLDLIGLVDLAEKGSWVTGLSVREADINTKTLFVCTNDLEDEYALGMTGPALGQALIDEGVCKEKGFLQAAGVTDLRDVTDTAAAKFCRDGGRKVTAAVAVGRHITMAQIAKMPAMSGLISFIGSF